MPDDGVQAWQSAARRLTLPGEAPGVREHELDRFLELGFPSRRDENWKYTRTAPIEEFSAKWLRGDAPSGDEDRAVAAAARASAAPLTDKSAFALVFINGMLDEQALGHRPPAGLTVTQELRSADALLGRPPGALHSLNAALATASVNIEVAPETSLKSPICLVHINSGGRRTLASPRISIDVGPGAHVELVEHFLSPGASDQLTNAVCSLRIGENARVAHYRLQRHAESALHVAEYSAAIGAGARLTSLALDTGGRLVRNDFNVRLSGANAAAMLSGIYVTNMSQHIDNHILIDHLEPNTSSRQDFSGIAAGHSRVVFNGKVHVHPGADGTDAHQSNRNLLLSDSAEVDTKPELEIYADDVKCSHGATVGQLDEDALFYLLSRGLPPEAGRAALTRAFVYATLSRIDDAVLREQFETGLAEKLAGALKS